MLHTILPDAMQQTERRMMAETGTPSLTLMERAAAHVANAAAPFLKEGGRLLAVCGAGNNGADGLAAVRILLTRMPALKATVWKLAGNPTAETAEQWARLSPHLARVRVVALEGGAQLPPLPQGTACVLDAMYGTGMSRPLLGAAREAALLLNGAGVPIVAVDVPSGLNGATGMVVGGAEGVCVHATVTVTFHRPKAGLFLQAGLDASGRVVVGDIGIPAVHDSAPGMAVLLRGDALLPARKRNTHKGDYGRVLLVVGSVGMAGAAGLCATAALRAGVGLCTVACPAAIVPIVQELCPCATCLPLPEDASAAWALLMPALLKADAMAVGCGLGQGDWAGTLLAGLLPWLSAHPMPAVLDADALNWLGQNPDRALRFAPEVTLTPHVGEAARLLGWETGAVVADQAAAARALHVRYGAAAIVKSASSVIVTSDGEGVNLFGTAAMAKGGSGDALAGVVAALLAGRSAYGLTGVRLLQSACALHGLAGVLAAEAHGERGMLASDLCEVLGRVPDTVERGDVTVAPWFAPQQAVYDTNTLSMRDAPDALLTLPEQQENPSPRPHATADLASVLGRRVRVTVDRPIGSRHPERRDTVYRLNYGYVADVLAADNEWQDAYVWGVKEPVPVFEGEVVAVIHRLNDVEDKWVVAAPGTRLTEEEVRAGTAFTEQYYQSIVLVPGHR